MSRDIDDLRHPEWSVSGSEGKSDYMWGYDEGIGNEVCFTLLRKIPDGVRVEVNVYGDTARYLGEVFTERAKHAALIEATFDPEHVALMEAVCDAAKRNDDERFGGRSLHYCIADLTAFRKERGL